MCIYAYGPILVYAVTWARHTMYSRLNTNATMPDAPDSGQPPDCRGASHDHNHELSSIPS